MLYKMGDVSWLLEGLEDSFLDQIVVEFYFRRFTFLLFFFTFPIANFALCGVEQSVYSVSCIQYICTEQYLAVLFWGPLVR